MRALVCVNLIFMNLSKPKQMQFSNDVSKNNYVGKRKESKIDYADIYEQTWMKICEYLEEHKFIQNHKFKNESIIFTVPATMCFLYNGNDDLCELTKYTLTQGDFENVASTITAISCERNVNKKVCNISNTAKLHNWNSFYKDIFLPLTNMQIYLIAQSECWNSQRMEHSFFQIHMDCKIIS